LARGVWFLQHTTPFIFLFILPVVRPRFSQRLFDLFLVSTTTAEATATSEAATTTITEPTARSEAAATSAIAEASTTATVTKPAATSAIAEASTTATATTAARLRWVSEHTHVVDLSTRDIDLSTLLEGASLDAGDGLHGEHNIGGGAKNLIDLSDLSLLLGVDKCVEAGDNVLTSDLVDQLTLGSVLVGTDELDELRGVSLHEAASTAATATEAASSAATVAEASTASTEAASATAKAATVATESTTITETSTCHFLWMLINVC
jgi:hypothetical protein